MNLVDAHQMVENELLVQMVENELLVQMVQVHEVQEQENEVVFYIKVSIRSGKSITYGGVCATGPGAFPCG